MPGVVTFTVLWPAAALLLLPLVAWAGRRSARRNGATLPSSQLALRMAAMAALVAALMQPHWWHPVSRSAVAVVVDASRSMSGHAIDAAQRWVASSTLRPGAEGLSLIAFAGEATVVRDFASARTLGSSGGGADPDTSATDIERALDVARQILPADSCRSVVLFTDGNETLGRAASAADRLRHAGIVLHTSAVEPMALKPLRILGVTMPPHARRHEPLPVVVHAYSASAGTAGLELSLNGRQVSHLPVALRAGDNEWAVPLETARQGDNEIGVRLVSTAGADKGEDTWREAFRAWPGARVLLVGRDSRNMDPLAGVLRQHGMRVSTRSPGTDAFSERLLGTVDVVGLVDAGEPVLEPALFARLESFVRDGGGLVFVAGEHSNGEAGPVAGSLERILPVRFEARHRKRDVDLVMLIDRSFSMRGVPLEVAKSAILSVAGVLEPHHRFGVTAFDARAHEVVPLRPAATRGDADDRVSRIVAGGQTNVFNALWHVLRQLRPSKARIRHVILLSDGNTAPIGVRPADPGVAAVSARQATTGDADTGVPASFEELASRLRKARISVSTVAIGNDADLDLLANLARWTGGRTYVSRTDTEVPELFVRDAKRLTNGSLREKPFRPLVREEDAAIAGLDFRRAPPLLGYALARAKKHARVLLEAQPGHPLLVSHHYGLGVVTAFMSDAHARWSSEWLGWPGYGRFWSQVVRAAAASRQGDRPRLSVARDARHAIVRLNGVDNSGSLRGAVPPLVSVSLAGRPSWQVPLLQTAPGRFEARVSLEPSAHPYRFSMAGPGNGSGADLPATEVRSVHYAYADEDEGRPADRAMLADIAQRTGGAAEIPPPDAFAACRSDRRTSTALWPACSAMALSLYLFELCLRRFRGGPRRHRQASRRRQ